MVVSLQKNLMTKPVTPGLYALRKMVDPQFDFHLKIDKQTIDDFSQVATEFQRSIGGLIEEIINPQVPFQKVEDKSKCTYCGFKMICHR
jgi:hypothetical protein